MIQRCLCAHGTGLLWKRLPKPLSRSSKEDNIVIFNRKTPAAKVATAAILVLAFAATAIWAQTSTSSLRGVVRDQQGGLIPGASVTLSSNDQSFSREAITNDEGRYQFVQVPPGTYQLRVEMTGFKVAVKESIELLVGVPVSADIELELGELTETVTISSEASQLNTTDASVGNAFDQLKVSELPLSVRNVVGLLSLQPGVNPIDPSNAGLGGEVAGARNDQNVISLDGVNVNDQQSQGPFESVLPVPLDSVQEFRVTTVGQGATQGRASGGQVSLVTRGGTNEFHGSVYEFHRNEVTAANEWFNNANGVPREKLIRNQFGFRVGGPVIKDRAFFFFNFEGRRDAREQAQQRDVPSQSFAQGTLTFEASDGSIQTLNPNEIAQVDPLGLGVSQAMLDRLSLYPADNDPDLGFDGGLNFSGFRFNAPQQIDQKTYVARFDFNLNERNTVSWRGTLADFLDDEGGNLAQFPGQLPAQFINNSKGFSTNWTNTINPTTINTFTYGFVRQGIERSGTFDSPEINVRNLSEPRSIAATSFGRSVPTHNIADNLSWIHGNHTFDAGINFRIVRNQRFDFANSFAIFNINSGALAGLGSSIIPAINSFIQDRSGDPSLEVSPGSETAAIRGMMTLLGVIADVTATFQFDVDGNVIPQGAPQIREFGVEEYEFYFQDSWQLRNDLTLTLGLRYSNSSVPYEVNGVQVGPTNMGLSEFFNRRVDAARQGLPSNSVDPLTFGLIGAANDMPGFFDRDKNNWAPRVALAWSPNKDWGAVGRFLGFDGKATIRLGGSVVYDRFGSEMIVNFDSLGSVGLATQLGFPETFDFDTAPRFNGTLPDLPTPPSGGFPNTPPTNFAVLNTSFGIAEDLVTPYSYLLNLNYQRELADDMVIEFGYQGRLGRKLLNQIDIASPLNILVDPASGQTWEVASGLMRDMRDGGIGIPEVEADPNVVGLIPYIENMFPGMADFYIPGSATANVFWINQQFGGASEADILHRIDVQRGLSALGSHTFFDPQTSTRPTWFNAGNSRFNAFTFSARKRLSEGLAFDFNYTWSHSLDNGSSPETGAGQFGGVIINSFNIDDSKGNSDFDIRQQWNANFLWQLPFGRGRTYASGVPQWLDHLIGGWDFNGILRYRTGFPVNVLTGFNFSTNFFLTGRGVPSREVDSVIGINEDGNPGFIFNKNEAASAFREQRVGETGPREVFRLDDLFLADFVVSKRFQLPWEGHSLQFRWELFNAFNNVSFRLPDVDPIDSPGLFGEFSDASPPREMQFALRWEF